MATWVPLDVPRFPHFSARQPCHSQATCSPALSSRGTRAPCGPSPLASSPAPSPWASLFRVRRVSPLGSLPPRWNLGQVVHHAWKHTHAASAFHTPRVRRPTLRGLALWTLSSVAAPHASSLPSYFVQVFPHPTRRTPLASRAPTPGEGRLFPSVFLCLPAFACPFACTAFLPHSFPHPALLHTSLPIRASTLYPALRHATNNDDPFRCARLY